jgi:rhomboid protease GluP
LSELGAERPAPRADDWRAWTTFGLIAANVAMFAFELVGGASFSGPDPEKMIAFGGNFGPLTCHGQPWRLLTAMFLHYGVIHIGMNMVCLYQIRIVERMLSRAEFLALYFAAGMVGGLASVASQPNAVSAGASGAVFGMFGAFTAVMVVRRDRIDPGAWRRTMRSLGTFFALNLAFGLSQRGIDLTAHVGGLATGFVGGFALAKTARPTSTPVVRALVVAAAGATIALGGVSVLAR